MVFEPDIVIGTAEGLALVAEAKLSVANLESTEEQLKRYMVGMQCPVGLLITREKIWVYRDGYTSRSSDSVQLVGEFTTKQLWRQAPPMEALAFELFVQQWLERLPEEPVDQPPKALRDVLREYVVPAVTSGEVRAAHPRYS